MPNYNCERCGKIFKQKCDYNDHLNRKIPCKEIPQKSSKVPQKSSLSKESELICNFCGKDFFQKR